MPTMTLDVADAAELAEMLQFLSDWLTFDHDHLDASLQRFIDSPRPAAYDANQLRHDLNRFTFLLGGDDGEHLFNPDR
jgi:hypothetical protein